MTTRRALLPALCLGLLAQGATAAPMTPAALAAVEPGRWEIVADGEPTRALCVTDPIALTQVRHGAAACTRLVIASEPTSATVHYACPGAGWGRTQLRVDTPRAVRIESQGIAERAPFAFAGKARRTGACGGPERAAALRPIRGMR